MKNVFYAHMYVSSSVLAILDPAPLVDCMTFLENEVKVHAGNYTIGQVEKLMQEYRAIENFYEQVVMARERHLNEQTDSEMGI